MRFYKFYFLCTNPLFAKLKNKILIRYELIFLCLIIIGSSHSIINILNLKLESPFTLVSPDPSVFDKPQKLTMNKIKNRYFYEITFKDQTLNKTRIFFNKSLFRNIPGPHKHKLMYISFFRNTKLIKSDRFKKFIYKSICKKGRVFKTFNLQHKVQSIKVINQNKNTILDLNC